jgi:hypothetical protein
MSEIGAASLALQQEVQNELRRQGIVVWLDRDKVYSKFVDRLSALHVSREFPYPVVGFRGSFLELLLGLEPYGSGLDRQPLLIHMPGFNEESIKSTPVLELYEAGARFRKRLETLTRETASGRVAPAEVEKFLAKQPTLDEVDSWLSTAVAQSSFGLSAALDQLGPMMLVEALGQPSTSALAQRVTAREEAETLGNYIHKLTGMDADWRTFLGLARKPDVLSDELHALAAWALCVEYVHDLKRAPHLAALQRLTTLSAPLVKACRDLALQVRRDHRDAYVGLANEVEALIGDELKAMTPEDLGHIDTFREEENCVLAGAVAALRSSQWSKAKTWCEARSGDKSFWLARDQVRRWAWTFVAEAADFGETLARHSRPFANLASLEHAASAYASGGFEVDRAHRRFEQQRLALLEPRLPHFGPLQEVVGALRQAHRAWADALAKDFAALCKEHGFLPPSGLQQRSIFDQVVHPLTLTGEKVAVFVIDAFRFEMATELVEDLKGHGTVVDLKPRLAELPTITSVGMNVLAPVAQGERLHVAGVFQGFKSGEFTVKNPEGRARAMGSRSAGKQAVLLKLVEVCEASTSQLTKDVKAHQLIVVHSKEIDDAGEANIGLPTFDSTLRQIKAAWHHLQLAGVKSFVFTADHGFLLQDETTQIRPFGTKRDPQRRYVLDEHARSEAGMVNVSVSSLGYDGITGYLLFREDTAVFATGNPGASFVHGGNSPQERIIPVLTVTRERRQTASLSAYVVEAAALDDAVGFHRMRFRVQFSTTTTTSLGFAAAASLEVAIRVPAHDSVRVALKDVSKPAALKGGRIRVPIGEWTEVFFTLHGPADTRVQVQIHHPDNVESVRPADLAHWYDVDGGDRSAPSAPPSRATAQSGWSATIADELIRGVFLHIEKHGAITEPEVTKLLGSPRAFRRFSLVFDAHLEKLPFRVRIETGEGGKRYVREGER